VAEADRSRISWSNWRAERDGAPSHTGWEFHLYTDAELTGEIRTGLGPYELINTVPAMARMARSVDAEPAVVLRARDCLPRPEPPFAATTLIEWPVADDVASLVSLILEIRLRSGGADEALR
jgi:hypothetical protein